MPQAITPSKTVETATILYGSSDPSLNLALVRARQISPDEMESAGFRDGFNNLGLRGSLYSNADYMNGWRRGHAARF
ncbi:MAG: hypothetical protein KME42_14030 [Tildeniella nuda ZEHNDER 1965/U140]|jgi:hypothetical protein|nr:hypothetical protein [Tildeniella nuda ZEHNDER 1965/U140]